LWALISSPGWVINTFSFGFFKNERIKKSNSNQIQKIKIKSFVFKNPNENVLIAHPELLMRATISKPEISHDTLNEGFRR
jgi:hypothetical protein